MRAETADFIEALHKKDQSELLGIYASNLVEIEQRMAGGTKVYAVLAGMMTKQGRGSELGVVTLSSVGVHWFGVAYQDWPWETIRSLADRSGYQATLITMTSDRVDFNVGQKKDSTKQFSAALKRACKRHMP